MREYEKGFVDGAKAMLDRIDRDFDMLGAQGDSHGVNVVVEHAKMLTAERRRMTDEEISRINLT